MLTGVTITGHDDGYIPLESGTCDACSATISVSYTPSSAGTIVFSSDVGDLVNQAISTGTSNYNVVSESFSGPGTYSLNITVSLEADSYMLPLKVVVETQLAGFQAEMTSRFVSPLPLCVLVLFQRGKSPVVYLPTLCNCKYKCVQCVGK